jgi:hypothetical protein
MSRIMEKGNIALAGRKVPGVIVSEPVAVTVETARGKVIPTFRADVISLRETNPENGPVRRYHRKTNEDLGFFFPRDRAVIGLDVTSDGEVLGLDALSDLAMESTLAFQTARLDAQAEPEVALD